MKQYYYIAYRKPRNRSKQYAGDGVMEANGIKEVRERVAYSYKVNPRLIRVKLRKGLITDFNLI